MLVTKQLITILQVFMQSIQFSSTQNTLILYLFYQYLLDIILLTYQLQYLYSDIQNHPKKSKPLSNIDDRPERLDWEFRLLLPGGNYFISFSFINNVNETQIRFMIQAIPAIFHQ